MTVTTLETVNPALEMCQKPVDTVKSAFIAASKEPDESTQSHIAEKGRQENEPCAYVPHYLIGGAKHLGLIVETPGLANVAPPPIVYRPHLPKSLSEQGTL